MDYKGYLEIRKMVNDIEDHFDEFHVLIAEGIWHYEEEAISFSNTIETLIRNLKDNEYDLRSQLSRAKLVTKMLIDVIKKAEGHYDDDLIDNLNSAKSIGSKLIKKLAKEWDLMVMSYND